MCFPATPSAASQPPSSPQDLLRMMMTTTTSTRTFPSPIPSSSSPSSSSASSDVPTDRASSSCRTRTPRRSRSGWSCGRTVSRLLPGLFCPQTCSHLETRKETTDGSPSTAWNKKKRHYPTARTKVLATSPRLTCRMPPRASSR